MRLSARKLASDRTPDRSVRSWFYTATMIPSSSPNPTNYSVGFSWDIPAGGLGLFNVSSNYSFREAHFYDDSNLNEFEDQKRVNASINWFAPNESWQVSVYGKNLNDHPNYGNLTSIAGLYIAGPMQKGRIYGIEVNFRMQ